MDQHTADIVLAIARDELGYVEGPLSNQNKYAAELNPAINFQPWCGDFVSWVFWKAGVPLPLIQPAAIPQGGFAYCPYAVSWARNHREDVPFERAQPGDIVLFDWERNGGNADHVGIVQTAPFGDNVLTIEGNTAPWNNSNGGQVMERYRNRADIQCVWRPNVQLAPVAPASVPANPTLEVDEVQLRNQLVHVTHLGYGCGVGTATFDEPIAAVVGAVINGPAPASLGDDWWASSQQANTPRAQVRGNQVVVTVTGLTGDCDVYVTAVAA